VPVSEASLPEALARLAGGAESRAAGAPEPQLELRLAAPEASGGETDASPSHALIENKSEGDGEFDPPLVLRRMVD
jgi:hypothetical protein